MNFDGILPCTFHPFDDELFSSWLVRLAQKHSMKVQPFCRLLFQNVNVWNRDIDKAVPDEMLEILASKTLTPLKQIRKTTLKSYEGRLYLKHNAYGNTKWILPYGIYHRERKSYGLVFCPLCLKKDGNHPYFRKHWRLAFSIICPHCNIFLHDRCPNCKKPIIFFRNDLGDRKQDTTKPISFCYNCQFDLGNSPATQAPIKLARTQRTLFRVLREGWKLDVIYPHLYFDVLHQILKIVNGHRESHKQLQIDFMKRFPQYQLLKEENSRFNSIFEIQPIEIRIPLLKYSTWLLEDFPKNFLPVLKYYSFKSSDLLRDMKNVPFWYEKIVIENFFISNVNRTFILRSISKKNTIKAPIIGLVGGKRKYNDFSCTKCNSTWIIKDGKKNKTQRYKCRNCQARFLRIMG